MSKSIFASEALLLRAITERYGERTTNEGAMQLEYPR
jgi:hypothetical protein